ncbi:GNAT family N-acetyltransferase [Sedimentitalea todarodis]|uniref:GNAT family N-acetyltransferase n=1 Tax=Sedimentitalea todarodis TaxID=1631240 RepID=A0ABU3VJ00_9RHOB|nr:GNAT family N-acetyltransferase [Sedimentitalea todarodis]MDU9006129.1 GNAT family N-acetyltransferase [Sedimentitalea todarodis]
MIQARLLGPADVGIWRALRSEGVRLFPDAFLPSPNEVATVSEEQDTRMIAQGGRYGVFDDATALGIAAFRQEGFERARHRASIGPFYITPQAQGSGAADTLIAALLNHAVKTGVWQLELCVAAANARAIAFYERHGFRREGRWPNAIVTADGPQHDWFYVLELPHE